ncbi:MULTISPECIES: glycoside hydrolase family 18 protein [unclassified Streptomyces]|uniref:glycoside hydrolase family 18 protein n=1 Tax=unclassified Streptomyces TaxID=2593676 RepID=UPI002253CC70|nr:MULTISPECIES: glycoside hydrolase family 18 protein [unclassified Streptomyces]MCX4992338.1 glycoside hydrolase family 18 protein [Streptomyces sp. NBC_00568]MCX5002426.1 glycoside hydrolase family 18 protein [Streptomyces sp. NBC_00638]
MLRPHRSRVLPQLLESVRPKGTSLRGLVSAACCAVLGAGLLAGAGTATADETGTAATTRTVGAESAAAAGSKVVGYFTEWGVYDRNYHVKNVETSGSAAKLTHINYAFGNVTGGKCAMGDAYAATDKAYTADQSVDGTADTWDQPLRGNFNQLRKLKKKHPNLKVLWSFGGWTWSGGFAEAARNPAAFAQSCYDLVENSKWADVFDGIDIDWEYPNSCGLSCDTSGRAAFKNLMSALRAKFGSGNLVTAAITADATAGGKIEAADYAGAAQYVDWYNPMTYDFFGAWDAAGPTAPHSPLNSYTGIPKAGYYTSATIAKLKGLGIPASKLLLGIGFYGRGWTGVTQAAPGGTATGPAAGTYEQGIDDYKVLKTKCPATGTVAGTAYAKCGSNWWSYDTPSTIAGKMSYKNAQGLGGTFFWELSGDTSNGELIKSIN